MKTKNFGVSAATATNNLCIAMLLSILTVDPGQAALASSDLAPNRQLSSNDMLSTSSSSEANKADTVIDDDAMDKKVSVGRSMSSTTDGEAIKTKTTVTTTPVLAEGHSNVHPRVALALGGGGTRGAAEIGILRVLESNGIPVDMIAGTSMGSLIGGLYIAGVSLDALQSKFCDRSLMKSFNSIPPYVRIFAVPYRSVKRTLGLKSYDGLYKGNVFRRFLHKQWAPSDKNIENLNRPFAAIAFNLLDGTAYAIRRGNLGTALEASCAIPVLRKPIRIGDKLFVDGGSVDNVPVDEARALGGDVVIAVNVDETVNQLPAEHFYKGGSVAPRMINLELAIADARHCQTADIVIHPNVNGIGITSTKKKDAVRAIEAGENAAKEALPAIREKLKLFGVLVGPETK